MSSIIQDDLQRGHAICDSIREHFEALDRILPRSAEQIDVHEAMLGASTGIIYGDVMNTREVEVIKYNSFKATLNNLLLSAPRRLGKTFAIAMAVAVFFLCIPNVKFVIVSQAKRSAGTDVGILGTVKKLLWDVFGFKDFGTENTEQISGKFGDGDERKISSYSGGSGDTYGKLICCSLRRGGTGWDTRDNQSFLFLSFFFFFSHKLRACQNSGPNHKSKHWSHFAMRKGPKSRPNRGNRSERP